MNKTTLFFAMVFALSAFTVNLIASESPNPVKLEDEKELLRAIKVPKLGSIQGVQGKPKNYFSELEGRALIKLRAYLEKLSKYSLSGDLNPYKNKDYSLASGFYISSTTAGEDGWYNEEKKH